MNNKEAIIDKIINDAKNIADENILKAQKEVSTIEESTNKQIAEFRAKMLPKGEAQTQEIERRTKMVTNLDCKKILLSKKRDIVDGVFELVPKVLREKNKKVYIQLISNMIKQNADDKDVVIICEEDKDIITEKVISDVSKKIGKNLTLSKEFGDFNGGVILSGIKFDKNLTFALEFELIKEESESELAKLLFGDK